MTGNPPAGPTVLRFPRASPQTKGSFAVTTPEGGWVMSLEVSGRGRQVDLVSPVGAPLGRIVEVRGHHWQLLEPGTGRPVAEAGTRHGVQVRIGAGPPAAAKGRGDEWDLVWERTTLLAVRKVPRKVAKHRYDAWILDPVCTPPVVAFAVHVRRWWVAAEVATQQIIQHTLAVPPPPPPSG